MNVDLLMIPELSGDKSLNFNVYQENFSNEMRRRTCVFTMYYRSKSSANHPDSIYVKGLF
jgi:hypothetical protein